MSEIKKWFSEVVKKLKQPPKTEERKEAFIVPKPLYYWIPVILWCIVVLLIFISYILPNWSDNFLFWVINVPRILSVLFVVWIADSIWTIDVDKYGGVTFFGKPAIDFGPGPKLVPTGLFQRLITASDMYEEFWPAKTNEIFKGDDKEPLPPGMVREWRFLTGEPEISTEKASKEEVNRTNMLDSQQLVAMSGFMTWRVKRERFFDFVIASGGDPEQVRDQVYGVIKGSLTSEVSKYTVSKLNKNLEVVAKGLKKEVEENLSEYGVEIITSKIDPADISHALAEAVRDANMSRPRLVETINKVKGEKLRIKELAEAKAYEEEIVRTGRGKGVRVASKEMGMTANQVFAGEVAENTIGETDTVMLGTETFSNTVGGISGAVLKGLVNKNKKPTTEDVEEV